METQSNHTFKWILISALICVVIAVFGISALVLIMLVPLIITIVWVQKGFVPAIIPYLISVFAALYLLGYTYALLFILMTFPAAVAAPLLLKQKKRMYDSVLIISFVTVIGCLFFTACLSFLTGKNIVIYITEQFDAFLKLNDWWTQVLYLFQNNLAALSEFAQTQSMPAAYADVTLVQMRDSLTTMFGEVLPILIPSVIILYSLSCGFVTFYGAHSWLKKHGTELVPAAQFRDLRVPRTATFALGIMVLASVVLGGFGLGIFNNISTVLMSVLVLIFSVQGSALFVFLYKTKRIKIGACIALIIFGLLLNALVWIGFFEGLFRIRERINLDDAGNRSL